VCARRLVNSSRCAHALYSIEGYCNSPVGPCPSFSTLGHTNRHQPRPLGPDTPSGSLDQYCIGILDTLLQVKHALLAELAFGLGLFRSESSEINLSQLCPSTLLDVQNAVNNSCGITRDQAAPWFFDLQLQQQVYLQLVQPGQGHKLLVHTLCNCAYETSISYTWV
jgi:hypothetical protein